MGKYGANIVGIQKEYRRNAVVVVVVVVVVQECSRDPVELPLLSVVMAFRGCGVLGLGTRRPWSSPKLPRSRVRHRLKSFA